MKAKEELDQEKAEARELPEEAKAAEGALDDEDAAEATGGRAIMSPMTRRRC